MMKRGNTYRIYNFYRNSLFFAMILVLAMISLAACSSNNETVSQTETVETESETKQESIQMELKKKDNITVKKEVEVLLQDIIKSIEAENGIKSIDIQMKEAKNADAWSMTDVKDGKEIHGVPAKVIRFLKEGTYDVSLTVVDIKGEKEEFVVTFIVKDEVPETEETESEEMAKNDKTTAINKDTISSGSGNGSVTDKEDKTSSSTGATKPSGNSNSNGNQTTSKPSAGNSTSTTKPSVPETTKPSTSETTKPETEASKPSVPETESTKPSNSETAKQETESPKFETKPETEASKPSVPETEPPHQHTWVEVSHMEDQGWDEPVYETVWKAICNGCGADITSYCTQHLKENMLAGNMSCGSYTNTPFEVQTGTKHVENIVKVVDGYKCACGATK